MQISKVMLVESPLHLWRILKTKEEIIDQSKDDIFSSLNLFMDSTQTYVSGCKCDEEENYDDMMEQYSLMQRDNIVSYLVKGFECDRIDFK